MATAKPVRLLTILHIPNPKGSLFAGDGAQFRLPQLVALMSDGSMHYHNGGGYPIVRYRFEVANGQDLYKAERAVALGLKIVKPAPIYSPNPRIPYLSPKDLAQAIRDLWAAVTWSSGNTGLVGHYFVIPKDAVPSAKWLTDKENMVELRSADDHSWRISLYWAPDRYLSLDSLVGQHNHTCPIQIPQIRRALKPWPDLLSFFDHLWEQAAAKEKQRRNTQLAGEEGRAMKERAELARHFRVEDQLAAFEKRRR